MGTFNLLEALRESEFKGKLVHVSTDYVFDGRKGAAYVESDSPSPLSAYGRSKLHGEDLVRAELPDHAIVLHPGPMNRGMEISADVADSPRSVMVEQVANGVSVRMAVLYLLLGGDMKGQG